MFWINLFTAASRQCLQAKPENAWELTRMLVSSTQVTQLKAFCNIKAGGMLIRGGTLLRALTFNEKKTSQAKVDSQKIHPANIQFGTFFASLS
jgi:hypothetical protein